MAKELECGGRAGRVHGNAMARRESTKYHASQGSSRHRKRLFRYDTHRETNMNMYSMPQIKLHRIDCVTCPTLADHPRSVPLRPSGSFGLLQPWLLRNYQYLIKVKQETRIPYSVFASVILFPFGRSASELKPRPSGSSASCFWVRAGLLSPGLAISPAEAVLVTDDTVPFDASPLGLSVVSSEDMLIRLEGSMLTPSPASMPVYSAFVNILLDYQEIEMQHFSLAPLRRSTVGSILA